jgi:hypothetical protein
MARAKGFSLACGLSSDRDLAYGQDRQFPLSLCSFARYCFFRVLVQPRSKRLSGYCCTSPVASAPR